MSKVANPTIIVTVPRPPSANRMFQRKMTKKGRRDLTPEYKEWRDKAGWLLRMQLVGVPEIMCRFDVSIEVPISRMDTDNAIKPLLDLCQLVHLISNDGNQNRVEIVPSDRADCVLRFTPLPDMGAIRKATKISTRPAPRRPGAAVNQMSIAQYRKLHAKGFV